MLNTRIQSAGMQCTTLNVIDYTKSSELLASDQIQNESEWN